MSHFTSIQKREEGRWKGRINNANFGKTRVSVRFFSKILEILNLFFSCSTFHEIYKILQKMAFLYFNKIFLNEIFSIESCWLWLFHFKSQIAFKFEYFVSKCGWTLQFLIFYNHYIFTFKFSFFFRNLCRSSRIHPEFHNANVLCVKFIIFSSRMNEFLKNLPSTMIY